MLCDVVKCKQLRCNIIRRTPLIVAIFFSIFVPTKSAASSYINADQNNLKQAKNSAKFFSLLGFTGTLTKSHKLLGEWVQKLE